ncbi:cobalamin biosynthesis protein [Anaerocolumna sp. AGMB13020]|uniref:cobalt-precorrin 5A hydrolase n=1 Tax=Anaerocolumna sp. AGMB13020 TaxID=3081750 RepID=UPI0029539602|nr:cobalamin biosynthesis protein [Anaerocolumna sp. AGMB13020]WOO38623.1 cobalamin biosynthesis protein [Anaerocolumna sp. AGMB13020]
MKITVISFTKGGNKLNHCLCQALRNIGHDVERFQRYSTTPADEIGSFDNIGVLTGNLFESREGIIYIGACGIAVRSIAPYLQGKEVDPFVLVLDEKGDYVISLLSGHLGRGNEMCREVAALIKAKPVITTATDLNGVFAVDLFAGQHELLIKEIPRIKSISAALLAGEAVGIYSEYPLLGKPPAGLEPGVKKVGIYIGCDINAAPFETTLHLVPKNLVLGIGCRKGVTSMALYKRVTEVCSQADIDITRISAICSVDLKREEPGVHELADKLKAQTSFYSAEELSAVTGEFKHSPFVEETAGVGNVCERSGALASHYGKQLLPKTTGAGIAMAVFEKEFRIEF